MDKYPPNKVFVVIANNPQQPLMCRITVHGTSADTAQYFTLTAPPSPLWPVQLQGKVAEFWNDIACVLYPNSAVVLFFTVLSCSSMDAHLYNSSSATNSAAVSFRTAFPSATRMASYYTDF